MSERRPWTPTFKNLAERVVEVYGDSRDPQESSLAAHAKGLLAQTPPQTSERDTHLERLRRHLADADDALKEDERPGERECRDSLAWVITHVESEPARVQAAVAEMLEQAAEVLAAEYRKWSRLNDPTGAFRSALEGAETAIRALSVKPSGNPCPVSFPHPPHDYCDGKPGARPFGEPSRETPAPRLEYCDRCDGCGWYEGGLTICTMCEACKGTGLKEVVTDAPPNPRPPSPAASDPCERPPQSPPSAGS